jgi:hypothetical protein
VQDFAQPTTDAAVPPIAGPVRVVRRDGQVFETTPEDAQRRLALTDPGTGQRLFTLDTPEAAAQRERVRTYGGAGGQVLSGLAGAARQATIGLSDVAAEGVDALAGTDITGDLQALREVNPNATAIGEIGGALAPLLLSGGGTAAARVGAEGLALAGETRAGTSVLGSLLRGVTAPTRGVEGLASLAERGVLRTLGTEASESIARRAIGRAASMGVGGAVEGAGMGVQQSLTEYALEDEPLTAQQLLANIGLNALLGGAGGSVLGAGGSLAASGLRGSRDVISRAFREATGLDLRRGVAEAWEQGSRAVAEGASLATGADARAVRSALGPDGAEARALLARGDAVYDDATRELVPMIDDVERGYRHTADAWSSGMKPSQIRRLVSTENVVGQIDAATSIVGRARRIAQDAMSEAASGSTFEVAGIGTRARDLMRNVQAAEDILARTVTRSDAADVSTDLFTALDSLKRGIGDVQQRVESIDRGSSFLARLRGEEGYEGIRRALEDDNLWGSGAANAQREVNAAYTRFLETRRRYVREFLGHSERDVVDPFREIPRADSARLDPFVRSTGAARNDTRAQVFRDTLAAQADLVETMNRHLDLGATAGEARSAADSARKALASFEALENRVASVNQLRALEQGTGVERALVAQGAGYVLGGPLGAAIATALASPMVLARGIGAIERAAARVTQRIDRGASSFVSRALEAARRGATRAQQATTVAARRIVVRTSVEAFREEVERVIDAAARPEETQRRIAEATDEIGRFSSGVQTQMQAQAMAGISFLVSRIPPNARPADPLFPGITRRRDASTAERSRFMRYVRAVNDPLSVIDDLEAGAMPVESVEVLRELFPLLHQQLGNALVGEIVARMRDGDEIPFTFRRDMSALMGAAADPSFQPDAIATYQRVAAVSAGQADALENRPIEPRRNGGDVSALGRSVNATMTATARREQRRGG